MKLEAVFDADGVILAAIAYEPRDTHPRPRPMAAEGMSVADFDIPEEHADTPLDVLCSRMRIDARSGRLTDLSKAS